MARLNFDEIKIFDDAMNDMDIIRTITNKESQENAFYIADIGNVIRKHQEWIAKLPKVIPYFGIWIFYFYILNNALIENLNTINSILNLI